MQHLEITRSQPRMQHLMIWCSMLSSDGEIQWFQWLVIGWDVRNLNSCDRRNPSKSPTCRGLGCVAKTCSTRNGLEVYWSKAGFMTHKLSSRLTRETKHWKNDNLLSPTWSRSSSKRFMVSVQLCNFCFTALASILDLAEEISRVCFMCLIVCCFKAVIQLKQI